ncbi:MAG: hypothetical protein R3325_04105 [Thermoanaerobaculia bacterium]|nr:hypothetical protein [Thermoanaerobaculia bacterium]
MTKKKELDELTDEAAIRRIFPPEVVREAKRAVKEAEKKDGKPLKPAEPATSD